MGTADKQYHIEGLRGLAILFIILFHLLPHGFQMGYLGVDVFLVISGYLLFVRPIQRGDNGVIASSRGFLKRKTGRLMPPLAASFLFSFAVSFFVLTPEELPEMVRTAFYALLGGSNIYLDSIQSGYFTTDTNFNPMVPTWYLSLTCQIYLLFLLGWLVLPRKGLKVVLLVLFLLSLAYANIRSLCNVWFSLTGIELNLERPSYYSLWARLWEVMAGGFVVLLPGIRSKRWSNIAGIVCVALLLLLFFLHRKQNTAIAFMVVASVLSMRYAGTGLAKRFLTNPVLLWLGKMSFSIYLVHMTIVIALNSLVDEPGVCSYIAAFTLVLACGALFYYLVERRRLAKLSAFAMWGVALVLSGALYSASPNAFLWRGGDYILKEYKDWSPLQGTPLENQFDADNMPLTKFVVYSPDVTEGKYKTPFYKIGERSQDTASFVLIGDSHAGSLLFGIDAVCREHGLTGVFLSTYIVPFHGCEYSFMRTLWGKQKEDALFKWLRAHPEIRTVIIGQLWRTRTFYSKNGGLSILPGSSVHGAEDAVGGFVNRIRELGKSVIIAAPSPEIESSIPAQQYRRYRQYGHESRRRSFVCSYQEYKERMAPHMELLSKMEREGMCHVLPIADGLFPNGEFNACEGGVLLLKDSSHLTPAGSEKAVRPCANQLVEWLKAAQGAPEK